MKTDLSGRVAIITGSSSGVGAATARLLGGMGCRIVINYATVKNLQRLLLQNVKRLELRF